MGGYALYVWGAYGVCALVLVWMLAASWHRLRAGREVLRALEQARPRRRAAAPHPASGIAASAPARHPPELTEPTAHDA